MPVYVVVRENEYFKRGTYCEDIDGGLIQQTTMEMDNGKYTSYRPYGIAIPQKLVRDFILRIQKHGIDMRGLKG